ncbi:MAG: hypothetical protein Q8M09_17285 [Pseudomonadota bacterium]|nr:hypothetical protein [Pseudomonadota bacterium]MDP1905971.1 hypothetical protein [Pseudomonadota bacterium]MDP2351889.1 hypothetical protein [Pseudomonadota bacterium]
MILGFAHLAINVDDLSAAESEWRALGYARGALHRDVPNHPAKRAFTRHYQPLHDLLLLHAAGLWPLEITRHGPTLGENRQLAWAPDSLHAVLPEPAPLRTLLLEGLGFQGAGNDLRLDSRLPGWSCRLHLEAGDTEPVRLDAAGPTCLAFYCNRIEEDAQRLLGLGASDYSGVFDLTLGERAMSIAMLRAPGGPLLELVSPRTRTP